MNRRQARQSRRKSPRRPRMRPPSSRCEQARPRRRSSGVHIPLERRTCRAESQATDVSPSCRSRTPFRSPYSLYVSHSGSWSRRGPNPDIRIRGAKPWAYRSIAGSMLETVGDLRTKQKSTGAGASLRKRNLVMASRVSNNASLVVAGRSPVAVASRQPRDARVRISVIRQYRSAFPADANQLP